MIYKKRYKLEELKALIDHKQERLIELDKEASLLREELVLLLNELTKRSLPP